MKSRYPEAAQAIRDWVTSRELLPGAGLPSMRVLAETLGFKPTIAERACHALIAGGFLWRKGNKLFVGAGNTGRAPIEGVVYVLSYIEGFSRTAGRILTDLRVNHRLVELSWARHASPLPSLRKALKEKPAGVVLWTGPYGKGFERALQTEATPMVICTDISIEVTQSLMQMDLIRGVEKAVKHLVDLGHRQIAHVSGNRTEPHDCEIAECYRAACSKMKLPAIAVWQSESDAVESLRETMVEERKRHPGVTALFAEAKIASLAMKTFKVPAEMSVVGIYGGRAKKPSPTVVALADADECIALHACTEIVSQIQAIESGLPRRPARRALFVPDLIDRGSTRALKKRGTGFPDPSAAQAGKPVALLPATAAASPWDSWRKTYPYLKKSRAHNWRQLDLSGVANHSMTRECGWLGGEPLLHFSPGLRSIHGVPFQVIEERRNGGRSVVTFRSPQTHSAKGKELPAAVKIPVGGRVKALYFLHGCALAKPVPFAEYIMHFKTGKKAMVPLIPLGGSSRRGHRRNGKLKPNLQDWWPGFEQQDFPHAYHATIFNPVDPEDYERTLYSLEWINRWPDQGVSHIEVRVDPKAGPTLALVAVTALM